MANPTQDGGGPRATALAPPRAPALRVVVPPRRGREGRREPTLAELAWTLAERRWTVAAVLASAVLGGAAFLAVARPAYEARVLVQVEGREKPSAPEDVVRLFDTTPPAESEMRILRSRALVSRAIEALGLDVEAAPRRFPVVGEAVARRRGGGAPAKAPPGLERYGWGGERIRVERLVVPDALVEAPLVLVAHGDDAFELRGPDGAVLAAGLVGTPASGGAGDRSVSISVAELDARPDTEFTVRKLRSDELAERLEKALTVTEQGKPGGLVEVKLEGNDAAEVARFLDALADTYVRDALARSSAEAESLLRVVEARLPDHRARAEAAEAALTQFHRRNPSLNLSVDAQRLVARLAELEHGIGEAENLEAEQARRHTEGYPELEAPSARSQRLRAEKAEAEARLATLPGLELDHARLVRDVAVATERLAHVQTRADELRTATAAWIGNARVLERASPPRTPVSPKAALVLALATLLGLFGGVGAALLRAAFDDGARDPGEIEAGTGLPVLAAIPRSARQARLGGRARGPLQVLSRVEPDDPAIEDLRALRTAALFALGGAPHPVVAIGSPAPAAGKTFVTVNLAHLLAAPGRRVLVVDGDLRRGLLHRYFGLDASPGLSEVLAGEAKLADALRPTEIPNLDLLAAGGRVANPGELLSEEALRAALEEARGRYDLVLVDTPPVLSVADCAILGRHAGALFLVVRSGEQTPREISLAVKRLARSGVTVRGAVLNDVQPTLGRYGRSGRYRRYDSRPT